MKNNSTSYRKSEIEAFPKREAGQWPPAHHIKRGLCSDAIIFDSFVERKLAQPFVFSTSDTSSIISTADCVFLGI